MADDANEDSWLYGTSNPDSTTNEEERVAENVDETDLKNDELQAAKSENEALAAVIQGDDVNNLMNKDENATADFEAGDFEDPAHEMEEDEEATAAATVADTTDENQKEANEEKGGDGGDDQGEDDDDDDNLDDDDDDSDDDINVVIGDIKAAPSTYNIKQRSNLLAGAGGQEKSKTAAQVGKFSIEEFEGVGTINGVAAHEFSIDSLEDKPWRKPGADITDYFNYGFNEETWRAYCERQKRFRVVESGVGLASLTQNLNPPADKQGEGNLPPGQMPMPVPQGQGMPGPMSEHMQMQNSGIMPPPGSHMGGPPPRFGIPRGPRPVPVVPGTKENAIQVMTAECREYSRPGQIPSNFGGPGGGEEQFFHEPEPFDYGYEPTQDSQWGNENPNWVPTGIKELTPGPNPVPPTQMAGPPGVMQNQMGVPPPQMVGPPPQMRHPMPGPIMGVMPPPNHGIGPPPIGMMMGPNGPGGPPMRMPMGPPRVMGPNGNAPERIEDDRERRRREREWERERERERERDRERPRRERSRSREKSRRRSKSREKDRDRERDRDRDRDRERDRDRTEKPEEPERSDEERERRRRDRDRDRERDRERGDRDRERSSRRERSRSREKSRRRSKSREKERERSSKTASASATTSSTSSSSRSDKKKSHRKEDEE